jgi:hypothetical protein
MHSLTLANVDKHNNRNFNTNCIEKKSLQPFQLGQQCTDNYHVTESENFHSTFTNSDSFDSGVASLSPFPDSDMNSLLSHLRQSSFAGAIQWPAADSDRNPESSVVLKSTLNTVASRYPVCSQTEGFSLASLASKQQEVKSISANVTNNYGNNYLAKPPTEPQKSFSLASLANKQQEIQSTSVSSTTNHNHRNNVSESSSESKELPKATFSLAALANKQQGVVTSTVASKAGLSLAAVASMQQGIDNMSMDATPPTALTAGVLQHSAVFVHTNVSDRNSKLDNNLNINLRSLAERLPMTCGGSRQVSNETHSNDMLHTGSKCEFVTVKRKQSSSFGDMFVQRRHSKVCVLSASKQGFTVVRTILGRCERRPTSSVARFDFGTPSPDDLVQDRQKTAFRSQFKK